MVALKRWATERQLQDLLCELVRIPSISGSAAEREFPKAVAGLLSEMPYFREHPELLRSHPAEDGRELVTALVRSKRPTSRTVVLLSHFDVVEIDCYGEWQEHAFHAEELTRLFYDRPEALPDDVRADVESGNWLFGRGVMDMKCGLAVHMSMLERAADGEFDGNVLLLAVPDEEVNSVGMRAAVPVLTAMAEELGLEYALVLNAEAMHRPAEDDSIRYLEKGSIGKALPGYLCYGRETHVAQPFEGLNGNYMAAEITRELELDASFCEEVDGYLAPPPTNLIQSSLMTSYSVTIPYRAVAMFNLLMLEKTVDELVAPLLGVAERAARRIEERFAERVKRFASLGGADRPDFKVKVLRYEELLDIANRTFGEAQVKLAIAAAAEQLPPGADDRQAAAAAVDAIALLCKHLAPMIVLFFAPPYYPPISSRNDPFVNGLADRLSEYAKERHGMELRSNSHHGAMLDLSYVGSEEAAASVRQLAADMPLWGERYSIPFEAMEKFKVPVMNLGPFGKDAHKWTERLNRDHAFGKLPDVVAYCLKVVFEGANGEK
ncbi:M20/M25/M40 family metallo-hydrolase [Cohnella thailandensis]|uniref:M20/M25/M40 family metallo-hydrolase n=1 Tax=Cohnella thailandensis TaxID=557557 RepID=UPI003CCDCD91